MDFIILSAIISLVILIVLYKFARGVLKIIGFVFLIFTIIAAVITVFVFIDINDAKEHMNDDNLMILVKDDAIVAGFSFSSQTAPVSFKAEEISAFNSAFNAGDLESIKGNAYKVYFMDYDAIAKDLTVAANALPQAKISEMLESSAVSQEMKNALFIALAFEKMKVEPMFLFSGFKRDEIVVYPETATFLFIRYVPQFILDKAAIYSRGSVANIAPKESEGQVEYKKA